MGFKMTLGGAEHNKPHTEHEPYTEGYNAGYRMAMNEMRSRTHGFVEPLPPYQESHYPIDPEGRRGRRARSESDDYKPMGSYLPENRQIGFTDEPHERHMNMPEHEAHWPMDAMMAMLHELKENQEHIKRGMASAVNKLDPRLDTLLESATGVLENPPSTWASYMQRKDFAGIVKMEGKELLSALEAHKSIADIRKELTHTLAAIFQLVAK